MVAKKISMTEGLARLPFKIPVGAEVKVKLEDKVEKGTLIATRLGTEVTYDLISGLGLKDKSGGYRLKKGAGDVVKMGDTLAERSGWLKVKRVVSQVAGTVAEVTDGKMKIRLNDEEVRVVSPAAGKVMAMSDEIVELEIPTYDIEARLGWGGFVWGELMVLGDRETGMGLEELRGKLDDKVMVIGGVFQKGFWYKVGTLGVNGVICAQVPDGFESWWENHIRSEHERVAVLVLGNEEGKFDPELWDWLKKVSGKMVFMDGESKRLMVNR